MSRLICAVLIGLTPLHPHAAAQSPGPEGGMARPNVILIMTDDQGYGDLGVHGNPIIRTPHLDALARDSASMTRFYVSPVCTPTRACLMTGRYNHRTRAIDTYIGRAMMEPEEVTIAEVLREHGYATGIFGKWHLGDCYPMRAMDQGFETSIVHRGGGIGQPSDPVGGERRYTDPVLFRNGVAEEFSGYCTDVYFDEAMAFMRSAREEGEPFFAYIPTNAPHGPYHDVPGDLYRRYSQRNLAHDQFPQDRGHALPENTNQDRLARIYAMITNIDDNVGRLMRFLRENDLLENTLVIFMTDNGPEGRRFVSGMRGAKASVYEGGIHVPFFARWPARLRAGASSDIVAAHIDVLPTILDACDVDVPEGLELDGRSILPLLERPETIRWSDRTIVIQTHRGNVPQRYHHVSVRNQRWKLVHASGFGREVFEGEPSFELYDMAADPLEMNDVAAEHPDVVQELRAAYEAWFDDVSATRPDNYAPPRIHLGTEHEVVTTLTRQDWRHEHGTPWAPHSRGRWLVTIATGGEYDFTCRFVNTEGERAEAVLHIGDESWTIDLEPDARGCAFEKIALNAHDTTIEVVVMDADGARRGAHQVDVKRR